MFAAITTAGVIAIVVGAVSVLAGAFYALVNIQGERIKETRTDLQDRVEILSSTLVSRIDQLDQDVDRRTSDVGSRIETQLEALGKQFETSLHATQAELVGRLETLTMRLDRVEDDLRAAP